MPWLVYQFLYSLLGLYFAMMLGERSGLVAGSVPISIYWNSSNEIFKSSANEHIIEVKLEDSVNMVCPHYPKDTKDEDMEFYIIYNVEKIEYDMCILGGSRSAISSLLRCSKRTITHPRQYTMLIESFHAIPGALEFQVGKEYYFLTTSVGPKEDIYNRNHGACKEKNMKLIIKVIPDSSTTKPHISNKATIKSKTTTTTEADWSNLIDSTFPTKEPPRSTPKMVDKTDKYKPDLNGNEVPHQAQIGAASHGEERLSNILLMCSLIFGLLSWLRTLHR
ncbi:ephrin-4-like isoform X2 [Lineus longissimus]|uniref:ephrin-4-like isoform X2 n=1 Tax=Lineus longissimus TaxID=88925 RepID=UPI002B4D80C7